MVGVHISTSPLPTPYILFTVDLADSWLQNGPAQISDSYSFTVIFASLSYNCKQQNETYLGRWSCLLILMNLL